MSRSTKNTLRIVSILLTIALVLMQLGIIPPDLVGYKFWFMVLSYGLLLVTVR
ncbi:hypothetical protein [Marinoscillum sp. MHG1-6]|uniref:hypothetical protein n=1 Tax=Marinoscillum sp. MHG1-6 TaxID=2959627 RepID=UPI00215737DC|nr:hypothetical protein [Marinoscillum sp. MHG1-6]